VGDRTGWIEAPRRSLEQWPTWVAFAEEARRDGLDRILVCGMGGSSLTSLVLSRCFAISTLDILDSTDPIAVRDAEQGARLDRTLFIIASKSGTTAETLAFYQYFAARTDSRQFVAITDPGSPLERLARASGFRAVFEHPPDVGGRYAALTAIGMIPAALAEIDGRALLERALRVEPSEARALGTRLAQAARAGRDKLVLLPPPETDSLGLWIEQLVAESSGKDGKGVVPIVGAPHQDGTYPDREIVTSFSNDPLDLGAEFLRWMYATAELCTGLGVNPFDQPDVEAAKALARAELSRANAAPPPETRSPPELRRAARPGDYVAILAYVPPLPAVEPVMRRVRDAWARATGCATTLGYGPRYLHATGQLHKGGPNTGLFLVITAADLHDLEIPDTSHTFGQLKQAQAMGDVRALLARGRRVSHVHLDRLEDVAQLIEVQ
jgi:hypothetical protein